MNLAQNASPERFPAQPCGDCERSSDNRSCQSRQSIMAITLYQIMRAMLVVMRLRQPPRPQIQTWRSKRPKNSAYCLISKSKFCRRLLYLPVLSKSNPGWRTPKNNTDFRMVEDNMKIRYHCACLHYNRSVPVVTITGLRSMRPDVMFLAVARVMSPLCVVVAMILVSQLLCSASMAADNNIGPTHLKDYVACQFTSAEESQWKDQENSAFIRSRHAAVSELQKAPQQKEVKQALKAAEKATNDVSLTVAIDAISDINVRDAVQQSRRDAQMQVPQEFKTPDDLLCSRSLLGWQEAADIFGRRIANTYLVIQVVVRNLNPDSDYLIQDVIVAAPNTRFGSGRD